MPEQMFYNTGIGTSTPSSTVKCGPHMPDAWIDRTKDKVGYEINLSRYFYQYTTRRCKAERASGRVVPPD